VATGLRVPWGLARLPDGSVLVSTRDSYQVLSLTLESGATTLLGTVAGAVSNVSQAGEGGLLGLAVSPTFSQDRLVHVYFSTASDNRIATVAYDPAKAPGQQLGRPQVVVSGIPHNVHHNGGRLAFGPDGFLYATTGEAENPGLAQDKGSLGGKILRMTPDGRPAPGNPFGTLVWSYGHRNVQGVAWDPAGRLWASEFGDKLADELNLIEPGRNYGWPATQGRTGQGAYTSPVAQWGTDEDSPSGIAYAAGSVWMAALKGQRLWRIPLNGTAVVADPQPFLVGQLGRLRSVLAVDDHTLLATTSNRDGRTTARSGDDRLFLLTVT
jgi:glucose/arabinose dehydrogenase